MSQSSSQLGQLDSNHGSFSVFYSVPRVTLSGSVMYLNTKPEVMKVASCKVLIKAALEVDTGSVGQAQVTGCRHPRLELESTGIGWAGV